MNKKIFALFAIFFAIMLFSHSSIFAEEASINPQDTYVLPLSLQEIEEEAFSNTAAKNVVFQDGLCYIGENAFSDTNELTNVFIPESTKYIAESAFPATQNFVIHGVRESYAEDWAKSRQIPFIPYSSRTFCILSGESIQDYGASVPSASDGVISESDMSKKPSVRYKNKRKSERPQDRPELNQIDYRFP